MTTATNHAARETLTVEEVAELLDVGRNTVYEAAGRGEIPHRRLGRRLIFSRVAVMEWLHGKPANMDQR
ncbi:MAG: helix-turn-helix domain-containing protein [Deltaproteobacteria bacterium]|nr:helix-turn-helix domain-containing protein [Deltaproteobacteria bacterium]